MRIILASHNPHKVKEFQEMLGEKFEVLPLNKENVEPDETGATYYENALIKAKAARKEFPDDYILADDSGIEIDCLGEGKPGVYTARYPNKDSSVQENADATIDEIRGEKNRKATYRCCLVLLSPEGKEKIFQGDLRGDLYHTKHGRNGFAYDFYFLPDNRTLTLAEMTSDQKNSISHRGKAVKLLLKYFEEAIYAKHH